MISASPDQPIVSSGVGCFLKELDNPIHRRVLPGLKLVDGKLQVDTQTIKCCEGTGLLVHTQGPVSQCELRRRAKLVDKLLVRFYETWGFDPSAAEATLSLVVNQQTISWFKELSGDPYLKGGTLKRKLSNVEGEPSPFWALAFVAAWRFGINPIVVNHRKTKEDDFFNFIQKENFPDRNILLVEEIGELWKPNKALFLEAIIAWCESSVVPLWLDYVSDSKLENSSQKTKLKTKYQQRIDKMKKGDTSQWLSPTALSRLTNVNRKAKSSRE